MTPNVLKYKGTYGIITFVRKIGVKYTTTGIYTYIIIPKRVQQKLIMVKL